MKDMKFCQSCGLPLNNAVLGTNADGSKNDDYCVYCWEDGAFTMECTMDEMIEHCSLFVEMYNKNTGKDLNQEEYKKVLREFFPKLKRWK